MREHSWSFTGTTGVSMLTSLLIRTKDTSPTTGATLESKKLIPNHSLRSIIRRFTEERTVALAPPPPNTATTCAALHTAGRS